MAASGLRGWCFRSSQLCRGDFGGAEGALVRSELFVQRNRTGHVVTLAQFCEEVAHAGTVHPLREWWQPSCGRGHSFQRGSNAADSPHFPRLTIRYLCPRARKVSPSVHADVTDPGGTRQFQNRRESDWLRMSSKSADFVSDWECPTFPEADLHCAARIRLGFLSVLGRRPPAGWWARLGGPASKNAECRKPRASARAMGI